MNHSILSPIPWEAKELIPDSHGIITKEGTYEIWAANGWAVVGDVHHGGPIRTKMDAEFIVKACNLYDELVGICKEVHRDIVEYDALTISTVFGLEEILSKVKGVQK